MNYEKVVKFINQVGFPVAMVLIMSFILYRHITVTEVLIHNNTEAVESLQETVDNLNDDINENTSVLQELKYKVED